MNNDLLVGDVVQITNPEHAWYPCFLVINEVDSKIMGYATSPMQKGQAYIFVKKADVEFIGTAKVVAE